MNFLETARLVAEELERYGQQSFSSSPRVVNQLPMREMIEQLGLKKHLERGGLEGEPLAHFMRQYLDLTVRLNHPGSLAHQVAAPHPAAAWATMVEGYTNNPMAIYEMGPAAASIEAFLIDWMIAKVGWTSASYKSPATDGAGGVLTHGGSLANLTALSAARSRFDPTAWKKGSQGDLALLTTADCHYSVARAAGIMGLGEDNVYSLEEGAGCDALETLVQDVKAKGKRPFALVANACRTATGEFDPLRDIAGICCKHGIWLHVDGAHGASVLLSEKHRWRLDGIELADSITWDAHKLLRTSGLCTALLVRDAKALDGAFHQDASYLFHSKVQPGYDFIHRTVECTKASLGFRLFVVLAAMGERGVAEYIDNLFDLTRQAYQIFRKTPGIECPIEPQCNILCFRVAGDDQLQLSIRDRLLEAGDFHLSTAVVGERRYLRAVLMTPETKLADMENLLSRVLILANQ